MHLPVYTELANFETRNNGRKVTKDLTVVLILDSFSNPVNTINSIYQWQEKTSRSVEFILLNRDKEGYKYDRLLEVFPALRVLLPAGRITMAETLSLGMTESLSPHVLFISEEFQLETLPLEVLDMYLSENSFGIIIPHLVTPDGTTVPNIVKASTNNGFLETVTVEIVGTSVTSLYPAYFCFLVNREAFLSRQIEIENYENPLCVLMDLGFSLWKEGYTITQARMFKAVYSGEPIHELTARSLNHDTLKFNLLRLTGREMVKGRKRALLGLFLGSLVALRFGFAGEILRLMSQGRKIRKKNAEKPVEDFTIFTIINKDRE